MPVALSTNEVGLVVGIISACAGVAATAVGIWAAVLTKRGNHAAARDRVAAAAQRRANIQPRPQIGRATSGPDALSLHVSNPGGVAVTWHVLVTVDDGVYYMRTTAGAGWIGVGTRGGRRCKDVPTPLGPGKFQLLASVAIDVDGNIWDVIRGTVTTQLVAEMLNDASTPYELRFPQDIA